MRRQFLIHDIDDELLKAAHARAQGDGLSLSEALRRLMRAYADGKALPSAMGKRGAVNRAASMTPDERRAQASKAARVRWAQRKT